MQVYQLRDAEMRESAKHSNSTTPYSFSIMEEASVPSELGTHPIESAMKMDISMSSSLGYVLKLRKVLYWCLNNWTWLNWEILSVNSYIIL